MFISEMCKSIGNNQMPLNRYIEELTEEHPAKSVFSISRIAPDKTRSSFFTSALATLKLFVNKTIYSMTCKSEFSLTDAGKEDIENITNRIFKNFNEVYKGKPLSLDYDIAELEK